MEALFQNRRRIGVGQLLRFVHEHAQGQGFRPHLHRRCPDGIGSLQRVTPLHPPAALYTPANRNIKPPDPRAAHDFFLILCFHPLHRQRSAALGALLGNGNRDRLVDMIRDRSTVMFAVGFPGLASWRSWIALTLTARKGSGLAPGGTLRGFQLLLQAPNLFPQSRVLVLRALFFSECLIESLLGPAQLLHQLPDTANWLQRFEKQTIL